MSTLKKYFFLTAIIFLFGCKKEPSGIDEPGILTGNVKVSSTNVVFSAKLINSLYVTEYGFVWSGENELPSLKDYLVYCHEIRNDVFSIELSSQFVEGAVYYLRAFYRSKNNELVYGNTSKFIAPKTDLPEIIDVIPRVATWGDTIMVVCKNLSYKIEDHTIKVQNDDQTFNFKINSIKQDTFSAVVPKNLNTFFPILTLNLWDSQVDTSNLLTLQPPVVNSISPDTVVKGDYITIQGENFYNPNIYEYPSIIIGGSVYEGGSYSDQDDNSTTFIDVEFNDWDFEKGKHYFKLKYLDYELDSVPFIFDETIIDKIIPSSVTFGDTVEVIGKRFPYFNISLDGVNINQLYSNRNKIVFQVPVNPDLAANDTILDLVLSTGFDIMGENNKSFNEIVYLKKPIIESLSKETGKINDAITIKGKNFYPHLEWNNLRGNTIWFGDKRAEITSASSEALTAIVPLYCDSISFVSVKVNNLQSEIEKEFNLLEPVINSIYPLSCTYGSTITITGNNFIDKKRVYFFEDGFVEPNKIYFNDQPLEIVDVSSTEITASFVSSDYGSGSPTINAPILLKIGNQLKQSSEIIEYSYPWTLDGEFSYENKYVLAMSGVSASIGGKGYIGLNGMFTTSSGYKRTKFQHLYEFDPEINSTQIIETIDTDSIGGYTFGFAYNSNLVLFLNKGIWEYNIANKTWTKLSEINSELSSFNFYGGFIYKDDFYVVFCSGSLDTRVFKFNLQSKDWSEVSGMPYRTSQIGVNVGDEVYIFAEGHSFLKYQPQLDQWEELAYFPGFIKPYYRNAVFYHDNKIYCLTNNRIFTYDLDLDTWTKINKIPPFNTDFGYSMTINGKYYVGGGLDEKFNRRGEEKIYQFYPDLLK